MKLAVITPVILGLAATTFAADWPLDAADSRITSHGKVRAAAGVAGQSLVLDGSSVLELKDTASFNAGAEGFTFSVWLNPYAPKGDRQVIAGKSRYSSNERQWSLILEPDGTLGAFLQQGGWSTIPGKVPLTAGHWHLATLSVGGGKAALYLNGKVTGDVALKRAHPGHAGADHARRHRGCGTSEANVSRRVGRGAL